MKKIFCDHGRVRFFGCYICEVNKVMKEKLIRLERQQLEILKLQFKLNRLLEERK
jgi:hypothetical protein